MARPVNYTKTELTPDNIILVRAVGHMNRHTVAQASKDVARLCTKLHEQKLPALVAIDLTRTTSQDAGARAAAKQFLYIKYDKLALFGARGNLNGVILYLIGTIGRARRVKHFENKRQTYTWLKTEKVSLLTRTTFFGVALFSISVLIFAVTLYRGVDKLQQVTASGDVAQAQRDLIMRGILVLTYFTLLACGLIAWILVTQFRRRSEALELARDITDDLHRERNKAITESRRTQAILSSIDDGVLAVDPAGKIILFNNIAESLSGYTEQEALRKHYKEILNFRNASSGRAQYRFINRALSGKRSSVTKQTVIINKSGSSVPVAKSAAPIIDSTGKNIGAIIVFWDVSKERELEKAKDEFVAVASHQLRTPATAVKQFLGIMLEGYAGDITAEQRLMLERAFESNERQLGIVNDLLNVASIDAGRMIPRKKLTNINELIQSVVDEQATIIEHSRQLLSVQLPAKALHWRVDPVLFRMIFDNLLSNANKYTPIGGNIQVILKGSSAGLSVRFIDSGVGIKSSDIPKLFMRFSRIPNEFSTKVSGSGLGLYLSQQIARLHGGQITVESQPDQGSEFVVTIDTKGASR